MYNGNSYVTMATLEGYVLTILANIYRSKISVALARWWRGVLERVGAVRLVVAIHPHLHHSSCAGAHGSPALRGSGCSHHGPL